MILSVLSRWEATIYSARLISAAEVAKPLRLTTTGLWYKFRSQHDIHHIKRESTKSFVDDLLLGRGVVPSRAAITLRSIETKPFDGEICPLVGHFPVYISKFFLFFLNYKFTRRAHFIHNVLVNLKQALEACNVLWHLVNFLEFKTSFLYLVNFLKFKTSINWKFLFFFYRG